MDVAILTFNSERKLRECIDSVYRNIPVNNLIVVDGFSTDKTESIIGEYQKKYGNVIFVQEKGTRGSARQTAIGLVKTDWFVFVDSDVVLCHNWYKKALSNVSHDVGAVWGIEVWSTIKDQKTLKMFLLVTRKIFDLRGGTHDTLVRTEAIRDIKIPWNLHVFEDAYIKDWIASKGYRVVACYVPFCIHYRPQTVWTLRGSLNVIVDSLRFGSPVLILKLVFAYGFYTLYSVSQMLSNQTSR